MNDTERLTVGAVLTVAVVSGSGVRPSYIATDSPVAWRALCSELLPPS